jgi:4-hydroxyphenylpyruvate dioxygenase
MASPLSALSIDAANPLRLQGIEYLEYRSPRPQALGQVLEMLGFVLLARHRSREVLLYRQSGMNLVVNAHAVAADEAPAIAAIALRTQDAAAAHARLLELGAWNVPVQVAPMELHIPAVHAVGPTRIYLVDRWREFSIFDVDFVPVPGALPPAPALQAGLCWFGIVQHIHSGRTADWAAFWQRLFGFQALGAERETGLLPQGHVLRSACGQWHLQLVEPAEQTPAPTRSAAAKAESWERLAFGTADVPKAVAWLRSRGLGFEATAAAQAHKGALTQALWGGLRFELIHHTG